ncbi:hypothetical protein PV05_07254 [Exophiala xenobiotica]|uniref:ribonuclease Z n=1 Tax=Exophiala xenobiotica TaxID=348802 RepID=A0A0D2BQY5_9EURO|nr:uncharacterized protein PV05_07254 [Exophiala xenobiotica]KIW54931.1 hypothetical protein PV05_07254 [Exophiala xenobiotica]
MEHQKQGLKSVGVRTNFHFQFITTPTSDTPGTSLILHFDNKRYIFGELCEGTQRASIQRGIGLRKVRGLFLAGKTEWNNGGLIGMILTMADVQQGEVEPNGADSRRPRLHIYGGPKQLHSLACARRFVFRTGMPLSVHEFDADKHRVPEQIYKDDNISVWGIAARPAASESTESEDTEFGDSDTTSEVKGEVDNSRIDVEQGLRSHIVNNMFDSDWKRDRLVQCRLKDIKLPALVWVRDPTTKNLTPYTCHDENNLGGLTLETDVLVRMPWPASTVERLPKVSGLPGNVSMSYVIKGHAQRGAFDPVMAKSLGLKPGPAFSNLVAGKSVQNDEGRTITPDMVLKPSRPGRGVAIFDVPSASHLLDLEQQLGDLEGQLFEGVEAAVWITQGTLPHDERFQNLLRKLKQIKHVISHPDICNDYISQDSSAISSMRLSNIASEFFLVPRYNNSNGYNPIIQSKANDFQNLNEVLGVNDPNVEVVAARRGLKIHIEPHFVLDESEVPPNLDLATLSMPTDPRVKEHLPDDMSPYRRSSTTFSKMLAEPEVVTLGTGSAAPSKYRNVSAVLLRMPDALGNYLFDCGEGTLGQLKRLYTAEELDEILFNLKGVWISHLHADHHLGTVTILQAAMSARKRLSGPERPPPDPPCLISEVNMIDYMNDYQSVLGLCTESLCTPIACHWTEGMSLRGEPFDFSQTNIPIKELRTVKVSHCHGAQAISVTFTNGFKFSYSGDCRPNELFCKTGVDSDVLVHEATFDDGLEGDARAKKHCTTGEAVGVALGMKAKNLILTHFSQRYQKIPVLSSVKMPEHVSEAELLDDDDAEMTTTGPALGAHDAECKPSQTSDATAWTDQDTTRNLNIGVAFDLMRVKISQIASMKRLFPAISKMFQVEEEKRERERQEIAAGLRAEEERKMADKLARQEANRRKCAQGQAKQKQAKKQKGNKRKLETEKEKQDASNGSIAGTEAMVTQAGAEAEAHAGERIVASASVNAKCAQNGDAETHGNGLGREAANSVNSATRLQTSDVPGPIGTPVCTDKAAEHAESTTSPAKRRKLDMESE